MINDFCNELNRFLQTNFSIKKPLASAHINNTIMVNHTEVNLYLRYKLQNERKLVIANIGFKEQRKGHGTKFLKFISEIVESHDIEFVYLECVGENSFNFGIKLGFIDIGHKNMMISSRDLIENFKKREIVSR